MNRVVGVIVFNEDRRLLSRLHDCVFQSPHWQADHLDVVCTEIAAFSAVQRFITPQCSHTLMPYVHEPSQCMLVADVFLTNRKALCQSLALSQDVADAMLIMHAYLKWGVQCTVHLLGEFMFALWNPVKHQLLMATDQLGIRPCFYHHEKNKYVVFSNELSSFRKLCASLTVNGAFFNAFSLDHLPSDETCFREVKKIKPAHQLLATYEKITSSRYWHISNQKKMASFRRRDDYFDAFRDVFAQAVTNTMRSAYPLTAHISGGLDSSSVACQAALLLKDKPLLGF